MSAAVTDADIEEKVLRKVKDSDPTIQGLKMRLGTDAHAIKLFKALKKNKVISSLSLFGDCVSNKNSKPLAEGLKENSSITYLAISESQLGPEGLINLAAALPAMTQLRSLILGPSKGNWGVMDAAAAQLAQSVAKHPSLTRLEFTGYNLGDEPARSLGFMLTLNSQLKALNLGENPIGDEGLLALARGLKENKTLKHLVIDRTIATPTGVGYIVKSLKQYNNTLLRLSLNACKSVDTKTVAALCDVLHEAKALAYIDVNECNLGNEGADLLFKAISRDAGLKRLSIGSNGITNVENLDLMLGNGLQELDLSENQIGSAGARHIAKTLRYNRCLTRLILTNCGVGEDGKRDLSKEVLFNNIINNVSLTAGDNGKGLDDAANKILNRNVSLAVERHRIRTAGVEKANPTAELIMVGGKTSIDMGMLEISTNEQVEHVLRAVCPDPTGVRQFLLFANHLTDVPMNALGACVNLTELDLSNNRLTSLPADIPRLRNLVLLDIRSNQVATLPAELAQLSNLTGINAQNNKLTGVPQRLLANPKLSQLRLVGNQLPSPLDALYEQWNNARVDLSAKGLRTLPPEVFFLDKVVELALNDNELATLPAEIGQLQSLKSLDVRNNKLNALPWQLAQLSRLTKLALDGNPLTKVPIEIKRAPVPKILEFLAALKSGSEAVYRSDDS